MGDYNPNRLTILGEEWVPIREENVVLSPLKNVVEYGHQFATTTPHILNDARFYVNEMPADMTNPFYLTAIYAAGGERESGPLRSVIIPVDSVSTTGGVTASGSPPDGATALLTPALDYYYLLSTGSAATSVAILWISYNVAGYTALLDDKRIVAANILLGASTVTPDFTPHLGITSDATTIDSARVSNFSNEIANISRISFGGPTTRFRMGQIAPYNATTLLTDEYLPWTYDDLAKFDSSAGSRNYTAISVGQYFGDPASKLAAVWYAAMEVVYCDEKRLYVSGFQSKTSNSVRMNYGANVSRMRTWQAKALLPTLAAGSYTVTLSTMDPGDFATDLVDSGPYINGARELYQIPSHPGVQINVPYPPETNIGTPMSVESLVTLPQLSLHTSGGPLTEVHVYGRQVAAQVYGSITATQEMYDTFGAAASYPWVRFYARRFGDTSGPLLLTGVGGLSGSSVSITPEEFDALSEIVDGWKEISLQFDTAPSMGATSTPSWTWSSPAGSAGSRWEVLGASAPAISGLPANLFGQVVSSHQLYTATYYAPTGDIQELTWAPHGVAGPYVSTPTADDASDAVLIFAQAPPTITGMSATTQVQTLTGVGLDCGLDPCGMASGLFYNRITWPLPNGTGVSLDSFDRTETDTWGSSDTGLAYTESGTATQYSVTPEDGGQILPDGATSDRFSVVESGGPDFDVTAQITLSGTQTTSTARAGVVARYTDSSNFYVCEVRASSSSFGLFVGKNVAGSPTTLVSTTTIPWWSTYATAMAFNLRFQVVGNQLYGKVWPVSAEEPVLWTLSTTDSDLTTGDWAGAFVRTDTTLDSITYQYQSLNINPPDHAFGAYELQRSDSVTDWETIMLASNPATTGFNDYEARVGLESSYRIRSRDVYDFYGDWSDTVTATVTSPGASGGDCLDDGHVLIFTSNESQEGAYNLAYASVWEGRVEEPFAFPEAGMVQLQTMYDRDFSTAFHGTERGGTRFQRNVLVQAAAISPETLEDFNDLSDMAWADLSYVCVRDEDGNRWFATVLVPSGRVQLDRTIYIAPVDIIEVTDTPTPVDP